MKSTIPSLPREVRHKTLSAYYSSLHTLFDYLTLSTGSHDLLVEKDDPSYGDILSSIICATLQCPEAGNFPHRGTVYGSQQEAIDRVLQELGRVSCKSGESRNVLLAGDKVRTLIRERPQRQTWATEFCNGTTHQYLETGCGESSCEQSKLSIEVLAVEGASI